MRSSPIVSIDTSRRSFLIGLGASLLGTPAIVRAASLMPVKALAPDALDLLAQRIAEAEREIAKEIRNNLYGDLLEVTKKAFLPRIHMQLLNTWPQIEWAAGVDLE